MSSPGMLEWIIILGVIVLLFGANKLPQLGGAIGESIKNFKRGIKDSEKESPPEKPAIGDKTEPRG